MCIVLFYNAEIPHSTLAYKTPDKYEALFLSKKSNIVLQYILDTGFESDAFGVLDSAFWLFLIIEIRHPYL